MIKFETEFECATTQDAIYALQEIMNQLEDGYFCGHLCGADGSWSCAGEDDDKEDAREVYVRWDVYDNEFETFADRGVPHRVWVPTSVDEEDISDWLSDEFGYCVESWHFIDEE